MGKRGWIATPLLLLAAGCGSKLTTVESFGLEQRAQFAGVSFPEDVAQPRPHVPVPAFPLLRFDRPIALAAPPDGSDRIAVAEQGGRILIFPNDPGVMQARTLLELDEVFEGGRAEGLLGFAFHPDHATNGLFYVAYSADGPRRSVVSRWRVLATDPDAVDPASEEILLEIEQLDGIHNGHCLAFGPDRCLYIASGDGGRYAKALDNSQNLTNLLGKVLRLEPDGSIPADNPFVGDPQGARPEIWACGLRNPWRMSFDRLTGCLWVGDVGDASCEEIDIVERAGNYGWPRYEGTLPYDNPMAEPLVGFDAPVHTYPRALGRSVTGGHVYRGAALPSLYGSYLYADYVSGSVWALTPDPAAPGTYENLEIAAMSNPTSFGEDAAGETYICSMDGNVYRLLDSAAAPEEFLPTRLSMTGLFADVATLTPAAGVIEYDVNAPMWSDGAEKRRWLAVPGDATIDFHPTDAWSFPVGSALIKHFEMRVAPDVIRRLETRIMVHQKGGWQGYTYRWNEEGTDADLLSEGMSAVIRRQVTDQGPPQVTWRFPGPGECRSCHSAVSGWTLGVRTHQLNRDFDYPYLRDNQLRAWNHIGLFSTDVGEAEDHGALVDPRDESAEVGDRARAYLDVNCATCHQPSGNAPTDMDLRYGVPAVQMNVLGVLATTSPTPGAPNPVRLLPGTREYSELWQRMQRSDALAMPPLGSGVVDREAVELIGRWIDLGAPE